MSNPMPGRTITIHVTSDVANDLKKMQQVTANVLGKLGCAPCHSGHILNFKEISEFVVNPSTLAVNQLGMFDR